MPVSCVITEQTAVVGGFYVVPATFCKELELVGSNIVILFSIG